MSVPGVKLPITAIVASRNEALLLPRCLDAVSFCEELIVIDVDSSDDSAEVARNHGAKVVWHSYVPIAEQAREQVIDEGVLAVGG